MMRERWFPLQHKLADGSALGRLMHAGSDWQIFRVKGNGRMLVARSALADRWVASQLIPDTVLHPFESGHDTFKALASGPDQRLEPVIEGGSPDSKADGLAFAQSLSETRKVDAATPLQDAIYAERFSRLLPTWTVSERATDEEVLGRWLTGGGRDPSDIAPAPHRAACMARRARRARGRGGRGAQRDSFPYPAGVVA